MSVASDVLDNVRNPPSALKRGFRLQAETQIRILQQLGKIGYPAYVAERVWKKALDSSNSYVRYCAARSFYFSDDDPEEKKQLNGHRQFGRPPIARSSHRAR